MVENAMSPIEEEQDHRQQVIEYFNIFLRRKWWFITPFLSAIVMTALLFLYLPKSYRSSTLILVEGQRIPTEFVRSTVSESVEERLTTIRQQILSRSFLEKIIDQFELYSDQTGSREAIVAKMVRDVEIKTVGAGRDVDSFSIGYIGQDPATTMNVTNRLAALFIEENLKIREQLVEGTTQFIDSQLIDLKKKLEAQESAVSQFKQAYSGELPGQQDANLRTLDRLQTELTNLKRTISPLVLAQNERRHRLSELRRTHQNNHPDVIALEQEIRGFERGGGSMEEDLGALKRREEELHLQLKIYERRIENAPQREQELAILLRDYDNTQRNYQGLLDKKLNAQISENLEKKQQGEQFRILDPANFPEKPHKPNPITLAVGGVLVGILGGLALVFGRENIDSSVRRPEELEALINVPILASILDIQESSHQATARDQSVQKGKFRFRKPAKNGLSKEWVSLTSHGVEKIAMGPSISSGAVPAGNVSAGLIAYTEPDSVLVEQYRLLFLKLHHECQERKRQVIAITSSIKGEGKTTTTSNLAIIAARDFGKKVLLIDADFKNPTVGKYFQLEQTFGLIDVVQKRCPIERAMVTSVVDNLSILPMGRSFYVNKSSDIANLGLLDDILTRLRGRYSDVLWNDKTGDFLQEVPKSAGFDYIFIDAPPLIPIVDMTVISNSVEGIVFVVRAGEAPKHIIKRAIKLLDRSKVIGTVLNRTHLPWMAKDYEYWYYSYVAPNK
jgi:Mrp family chromosome partitioning ATPase/uncharacterized protein involved in exopolysaccharide biosynthesis